MRTVPLVDIESVIEFINEHSAATRTEAGEAHSAYPGLDSVAGLAVTTEEAVEVANTLFACLELVATQNDTALVHALNDLAVGAQLSYRLLEAAKLGWVQPSSQPVLLGAAVASLLEFVSDLGPDRLGFCSATRCIDLYADRSRGGRRQYCSEGCGARSRVARWRQQEPA